jgi:hypothetical protein
MTALAIFSVLAIPVVALVVLLRLVDGHERRRREVVSRQITLTDAIHAALGPVVAPLVRRDRHGRWIGVLAVPAGYPHIGLMVEIAQAELGPAAEIVLLTQAPAPPSRHRSPAPPALALSSARAAR